MDGSSHFTRFRTPRTPASLRQMYDEAIDMPNRPTFKGPNTHAPSSVPTAYGIEVRTLAGRGNSHQGRANSSAGGSHVQEQTSQRAGIWIHHAHLITDIGHREYKVSASEELGAATTDYDVPKLAAMFPVYTATCVRFSQEEDLEPEGFIACVVYALCEPPYAAQRHNVYKRLAFECFYQTCIEFPQFLYDAIQARWSSPGEVFTKFIPTHLRR